MESVTHFLLNLQCDSKNYKCLTRAPFQRFNRLDKSNTKGIEYFTENRNNQKVYRFAMLRAGITTSIRWEYKVGTTRLKYDLLFHSLRNKGIIKMNHTSQSSHIFRFRMSATRQLDVTD